MKKSSLYVKDMINNNLDNAFYKVSNYGIIRLIKYSVDSRDYYLSTNIFNKNIDYFKIMYHKWWENGFCLKKSFREK